MNLFKKIFKKERKEKNIHIEKIKLELEVEKVNSQLYLLEKKFRIWKEGIKLSKYKIYRETKFSEKDVSFYKYLIAKKGKLKKDILLLTK